MANILSNLRAPVGANRNRTRKGRGVGSGLGKTAGKGQKGQKARNPGNFSKLAFQGGQTPIQRRLPKRGFRNPFSVDTATVNVSSIARRFAAGAVVDVDALKNSGLVDADATRVKVLGDGELTHAITLKVHAVSAGAKAKIEAAGGSVALVETTSEGTKSA